MVDNWLTGASHDSQSHSHAAGGKRNKDTYAGQEKLVGGTDDGRRVVEPIFINQFQGIRDTIYTDRQYTQIHTLALTLKIRTKLKREEIRPPVILSSKQKALFLHTASHPFVNSPTASFDSIPSIIEQLHFIDASFRPRKRHIAKDSKGQDSPSFIAYSRALSFYWIKYT